MPPFDLKIVPDTSTLAQLAVQAIHDAARNAIRERGRFLLVLAGGSTPEKAYTMLDGAEWDKWHIFFGDERYVPANDPRSNYSMACRTLLERVPIPPQQVHPMKYDEHTTVAVAARQYELQLTEHYGSPPIFDLVLLGMGDDGHTASLFPGRPALHATGWVTDSLPGVLPPPVERITMTFPLINAAREVVFLVGGANKAEALRDVMGEHIDIERRPAAGVRPVNGVLRWYVDEAAARLLHAPN